MRIVLRSEDVAKILSDYAMENHHTLDVVVTENKVGGYVIIIDEDEAKRLQENN